MKITLKYIYIIIIKNKYFYNKIYILKYKLSEFRALSLIHIVIIISLIFL